MQAEYWLEHVRAFGNDAQVLIVGNKANKTQVNLDFFSLKEKFMNIVDFYPVSCTQYKTTYKPEFDKFCRDFTSKIKEIVQQQQIYFTNAHFGVLTRLQEFTPRKSFLEEKEFNSICNEYNVKEEGNLNRDWLLKLLDDLGIIIHFEKIKWLKAYVLNPHWLTYGVYKILYEEKTKRQLGKIRLQDVVSFLNQKPIKTDEGVLLKYPEDRCHFIIEAMEQFELCYYIDKYEKIYTILDLLPSDRPQQLKLNKSNVLSFDFDFEGLLPRHLIANLIVRRHSEIYQEIVWKNGVHLYNQNFEAEALIQADYYKRRFSLWINGLGANRYFSILHDDIIQMLKRMPNLDYKEWVGLPNKHSLENNQHIQHRAPFRDLLALENAGESRYISQYGTYNLTEVLKIMPKEKHEEQAAGIIIRAGGNVDIGTIAGRDQKQVSINTSRDPAAPQKLNQLLSEMKILLDSSELPENVKQSERKQLEQLAHLDQKPPVEQKTLLDQAKGAIELVSSLWEGGKKLKDSFGEIHNLFKTI